MSQSLFQSLACSANIVGYCHTRALHSMLRVSSVHRQRVRHCLVNRCIAHLTWLNSSGSFSGCFGRDSLAAIETLGDIADKGDDCAILALRIELEKPFEITTCPPFISCEVEATSEALAKLVDEDRQDHPDLVVVASSHLNHSSAVVRQHAVHALGAFAQHYYINCTALLVTCLQDNDSETAFFARAYLDKVARVGDARIINAMIALLRHNRTDVICRALQVLGKVAKRDDRVIATLAGLLDDKPDEWNSETVEEDALRALGDIAFKEDIIVMKIVRTYLDDELPGLRAEAIMTFVKLSEKGSRDSVSVVLGYLQDKESEVREVALRALQDLLEKGDHHIILAVTGCLGDDEVSVREGALHAIQVLSEKGDPHAISAVTACLTDHASEVRRTAIETLLNLAEVGSDSFNLALRECLKAHSEGTLFGSMIYDAPDIINAVASFIDDEDPDVKVGLKIMRATIPRSTSRR